MTSLAVAPFLLGVIMTSVDTVHYNYTFKVNIRSLFFRPGFTERRVARLSANLKCYDVPDGSMCRVGGFDLMRPTPEELQSPGHFSYANRRIDHRALEKESEPFQIQFSSTGISGYVVERNVIPARMMNLYRTIADQLNVGADVRGRNEFFDETEQSVIGSCRTRFLIERQDLWSGFDMTLTSSIDLNLQRQRVLITKERRISKCQPFANYSFSVGLWPEFTAKTATMYTLIYSTSFLNMSSHDLESLTDNVFNLYDENSEEVGIIIESVKLTLDSYRMLSSNYIVTFDKKATVLLDVFNDEKA